MIPRTISPGTIRTLLAGVLIALMVRLVQSRDALRDFTKPVVITVLHLLGITAQDQGEMMAVGHLQVPWTRDCAGVNLLLILLALAVWVNRHEKIGGRFWARLALMVPAALAANVARVLALITVRAIIYPAVESPQTHYFMGLVWLVPFVTLITPKGGRPAWHSLFETFHAAAVVALLAPMSGAPNGTLITLAAVASLTQCRVREDHLRLRAWLVPLWLTAGAGIALINMESFWLPWLLVCPPLISAEWATSLAGILCVAGSHSMLAMQPWAEPVGWAGIALAVRLRLWKPAAPPESTASTASHTLGQVTLCNACLVCFALPFTASSLLSCGHDSWKPPVTVESRPIEGDGFDLRLPGQPPTIGLVCYASSGRERHHTVKVCLKYRGIEVTPVDGSADVFTDGEHWMREFFLQDGALLPDYSSYLRSTFRPWAPPGEHLIFVGDKDKLTPAEFNSQCLHLANLLHVMCEEHTPTLAQQP